KYIEQRREQLKQIQEWNFASGEERLKMSEKIQENAVKRYSENQKAEERRKQSIAELKDWENEISLQRVSLLNNNLEDIKTYAANNREDRESYAKRQTEKNDQKVQDAARKIQQEKSRYSTALDDAAAQADI